LTDDGRTLLIVSSQQQVSKLFFFPHFHFLAQSTRFYIMGHGDVIADISDIAENEWYKGCAAGEDRP